MVLILIGWFEVRNIGKRKRKDRCIFLARAASRNHWVESWWFDSSRFIRWWLFKSFSWRVRCSRMYCSGMRGKAIYPPFRINVNLDDLCCSMLQTSISLMMVNGGGRRHSARAWEHMFEPISPACGFFAASLNPSSRALQTKNHTDEVLPYLKKGFSLNFEAFTPNSFSSGLTPSSFLGHSDVCLRNPLPVLHINQTQF